MDLNKVLVADIESDGFLDKLTKLHVLSVGWKDSNGKWQIKSTNAEEDVRKVFENKNNFIVMHNGRRFDKAAVEKIYNFKVEATIIDSLALSWWLYPNRQKEGKKFGLEFFGEDFGVPKPKISNEEWIGLSKDEEDIIKYYEEQGRA